MRAQDLRPESVFPAAARFGDLPQNREPLREFLGGLARRGIRPLLSREDGDVVVRYRLSVADALALGYDRHAPDELASALEDAFPEMCAESEALRERVAALREQLRRRRRAG